MTTSNQSLKQDHNELQQLETTWRQNQKANKRNQTYTISHRLLGLFLIGEEVTVVKSNNNNVKKIMDVPKPQPNLKSLERKRDPKTGQFLKSKSEAQKKRR